MQPCSSDISGHCLCKVMTTTSLAKIRPHLECKVGKKSGDTQPQSHCSVSTALVFCFVCVSESSFPNVLTVLARSPTASQPECPGPAAHLGAQQRDRDGGGEEVPQPQLPQPLPELEHQRQVGQRVWRVIMQRAR